MMNTQHGCGTEDRDCQTKEQDIEIRKTLGQIRNKILVMSGKGGVGKSSIAACLALALVGEGFHVGLMDVDLHGPSIPRLIGLKGGVQPSFHQGKALPIPLMPGLEVISIEPLMGGDRDRATIWRGPLKIGVIRQFIADIEWPPLDYLIIDSPPGTGDEPLTVAQTIPDAKAIVVTTPQEISLADVRKSINFCREVHMEILGIVENMSGMDCPHCGNRIDIFKTRGGQLLAEREKITLLGSLPFDPEMVKHGDEGTIGRVSLKDEGPFGMAFKKVVDQVIGLTNFNKADKKEVVFPMVEPKKNNTVQSALFAVPVAEGRLCNHFGHCEQFALIKTENGTIREKSMITPPPHEPGLLPKWLHEKGAGVIIAGGMGSRAKQLFQENGIEVITGAPVDSPESLVMQYLSQSLITGQNTCDH